MSISAGVSSQHTAAKYLFIYSFAQAHTSRTIRQELEQDSKAQTCTDSYPKITENPTQYKYVTNYCPYLLGQCFTNEWERLPNWTAILTLTLALLHEMETDKCTFGGGPIR